MLEELMVPEVGVEFLAEVTETTERRSGNWVGVPPLDTPTGLCSSCPLPPAQMVSAALVHAAISLTAVDGISTLIPGCTTSHSQLHVAVLRKSSRLARLSCLFSRVRGRHPRSLTA